MRFPQRQAAIVGIYTAVQGQLHHRTSFDLVGVDRVKVSVGSPVNVVYGDTPDEDITVYRFGPVG